MCRIGALRLGLHPNRPQMKDCPMTLNNILFAGALALSDCVRHDIRRRL